MRNIHWLQRSCILLLMLTACSEPGSRHRDDPSHAAEQLSGVAHGHAATTIRADMAERFGVETAPAGPGEIVETFRVYGRVKAAPAADVTVHARFPGRVEAVAVQIGDIVAAGALLATVESNESLKAYNVLAPRGGVIADRRVNAGEQTGDRAIVRLVDLSEVWVELALFPSQRPTAAIGQSVMVRSADDKRLLGAGVIDWIALEAEPDQSLLARVVLPNPDRMLLPGMLVTGDLVVATHPVALAVERPALQTSGTDTIVYVQDGERYEARVVRLGREDGAFAEVLEGLESGELYVRRNSYLVKADIEKAGAGHEH